MNSDCKHLNTVDTSNVGKYGKCSHCSKFEHFNCAYVETHLKARIESGSVQYICTECLTKSPELGLLQVENMRTNSIEEAMMIEVIEDIPSIENQETLQENVAVQKSLISYV